MIKNIQNHVSQFEKINLASTSYDLFDGGYKKKLAKKLILEAKEMTFEENTEYHLPEIYRYAVVHNSDLLGAEMMLKDCSYCYKYLSVNGFEFVFFKYYPKEFHITYKLRGI